MDKETFCWILESALLCYEGIEINKLIEKHEVPEKLANVGVKLCNYLKSIELNKRRLKNEI